ncbi:MAG TPA: phosphoribosylamine--glycine ligase [Roseiflexaceae bacterium]|nr:phosphoribosylamine--glycine ligase [Roseiflexaceae bacterium]
MNVLLVGGGGREHALAWRLRQSPLLDDLFVAPGNPGTAQLGHNVPVEAGATELLVDIARRERVGLVVVGPEAPLAAGLADACAAAGVPVFGPTAAAARVESSKAFAKRLMQEAGVPTAAAHIFEDAAEAAGFARASRRPWVVKADGLAAGKGVVVPEDVDGTLEAIGELARTAAGVRLVLEERLRGPEVSLIALCDGTRLLVLPPAQDHKRLLEGDRGPNTGGMGAYAPAPHLSPEDARRLADELLAPVVRTLAAAGTPFRGALYAGLMLTEHGPRVLEFNARFGDPETQALVPLLEGDLLAALLACAEGRLDPAMLGWARGTAACVVLAAAGYPEAPRLGDPISGVEAADEPGALIFHAGTAWEEGRLVTAGGRVLGVTGLGRTLHAALARAYEVVDIISFAGMQYRRDIGAGAR